MPKVSHGRPDLRPATKEPARAGHGWTQWVLRDASSLASPGGNDYRAGPVAMDPRPGTGPSGQGDRDGFLPKTMPSGIARSCKFRYKS